jgi:hypothetical protein
VIKCIRGEQLVQVVSARDVNCRSNFVNALHLLHLLFADDQLSGHIFKAEVIAVKVKAGQFELKLAHDSEFRSRIAKASAELNPVRRLDHLFISTVVIQPGQSSLIPRVRVKSIRQSCA